MKNTFLFILIFLFGFHGFVCAEKTKGLSDKYEVNPNFFFKEYRLEESIRIELYKEILKKKLQLKRIYFSTLSDKSLNKYKDKLGVMKVRTLSSSTMSEHRKNIRLSLMIALEEIIESSQKGASYKNLGI